MARTEWPNRRGELVEAAARCFAARGYAEATVRDIASEAGMQTASIYYHFSSKEDLFIAVHEESIRRISSAVLEALDRQMGGWERLEAACIAHLSNLLDGEAVYSAVMQPLAPDIPGYQAITEHRDQYEAIFTSLIAELDLVHGVDRRMLRFIVLGAMNWAHTWYRPSAWPADQIARALVSYIRLGVGVT